MRCVLLVFPAISVSGLGLAHLVVFLGEVSFLSYFFGQVTFFLQ